MLQTPSVLGVHEAANIGEMKGRYAIFPTMTPRRCTASILWMSFYKQYAQCHMDMFSVVFCRSMLFELYVRHAVVYRFVSYHSFVPKENPFIYSVSSVSKRQSYTLFNEHTGAFLGVLAK